MSLEILPLLQLILVLQTTTTLSYPNPIYGTKRYGRSSQQHSPNTYDPYSHQNLPRYPVNYYKFNPYTHSYPESYYYPQESYQYPMYYAPARTSKYEIYQAVLPYYYQEAPLPRQAYTGYYDYSDNVDDQDELLQEVEREEREELQPIGHESYYENDRENSDEANVDDINAAFLQNLILTQMYQDSVGKNNKAPMEAYSDYDEDFARLQEDMDTKPTRAPEDETVKELKQLQKANRKGQYRNKGKLERDNHWTQNGQGEPQRKHRQRKQKQEDKRNSNEIPFSSDDVMVYYDRKPILKTSSTVPPSTSTTGAPERDTRGQKEEFQMRPATPVRNPFASPVMEMMSKDGERKRTPSVYDTIKHLLDMEKSMENVSAL
ncbi:hypothetical protein JTB14_009620 [Gonioctena quinquepunctata]|nr:hypothetical protein JTB14_009620 [Gonioctena quinquepunctata]